MARRIGTGLPGLPGKWPGGSPPASVVAEEARRLATGVLRVLIRLYQLALSPLLGGQCRFHPSCSNYALEAISRHGPVAGCQLAVKRLLRCHPFHPGGIDPPPEGKG